MRKPRMTKAEKLFVQDITKLVFTVPVDENRKKIDDEIWNTLSPETQDRYLTLLATKTR